VWFQKTFGFNFKLTGELEHQVLLPDKLSLTNPMIKLQEENILFCPPGVNGAKTGSPSVIH
jgi:hypothetical protein